MVGAGSEKIGRVCRQHVASLKPRLKLGTHGSRLHHNMCVDITRAGEAHEVHGINLFFCDRSNSQE